MLPLKTWFSHQGVQKMSPWIALFLRLLFSRRILSVSNCIYIKINRSHQIRHELCETNTSGPRVVLSLESLVLLKVDNLLLPLWRILWLYFWAYPKRSNSWATLSSMLWVGDLETAGTIYFKRIFAHGCVYFIRTLVIIIMFL